METVLAPASPTTSRAFGVNVNAKGTGVADGLATGVADRLPSGRTWNASIRLPLALVVTSTCRPSGVNPIWPGEVRKKGGSVFASPSERAEPGMRTSRSSAIRNPCTIPDPPELSTYTSRPCTAMLAGNWPPEGTTLSSRSRSPCTLNVDTESLPALTAISTPCAAS